METYQGECEADDRCRKKQSPVKICTIGDGQDHYQPSNYIGDKEMEKGGLSGLWDTWCLVDETESVLKCMDAFQDSILELKTVVKCREKTRRFSSAGYDRM